MFFCIILALVRALALPAGFTVNPEAETRQIAISSTGTVAAIAEPANQTYRLRAFRWSTRGQRDTFTGLRVRTQPGGGTPGSANAGRVDPWAIAAGGDQLYVTAATSWSGAYSGTSTEVQRWGFYTAAYWALPQCVDSGDSLDQHAFGGDADGRLAITIDRSGAGSFQVMGDDPERFAPYAYVVRNGECRNLGRGIVQDVRGPWAAGYRTYLNGKIAPDNLNTAIQKAVASRWYGRHLRELGAGDALAITSDGFTVGADAVPGRTGCMSTNFYSSDHAGHTYCPDTPHAVAWDRAGRRIALAPHWPRSVAYDASNDGTVVGMMTDAAGRHYAFRWRNGTLQRLDDLPHPPGWRFESAYAIGPDGSIAGIGLLNGVATVFVRR